MPSLGLSSLLMRQQRLCAIRGTVEKWNRWAGGPAHLVYISDVHLGFPDSSVGREFVCNIRDPGLIPGSGRSARERTGYPRQYSWASLVAQLVKNLPAVWETWVWSPDWKIPWRRERPPTPVFGPGEFHGLYSPWGHKESDTTEQLSLTQMSIYQLCNSR